VSGGRHPARGCKDDAAQFARVGYLRLPGLIAPALADYLWSYLHTKFASLLMARGDPAVPGTPCAYGDAAFDGLLEFLRPQIERHTGLRLHPTFSYVRLYKRGDELRRHRDRPSCEVSATLNIGQVPSEPWSFHVRGADGPDEVFLTPGDGLLYRGCDCPHWRGAYAGNRLGQVFLHYVDRDGPYSDRKFDRRETLMRPRAARPPPER